MVGDDAARDQHHIRRCMGALRTFPLPPLRNLVVSIPSSEAVLDADSALDWRGSRLLVVLGILHVPSHWVKIRRPRNCRRRCRRASGAVMPRQPFLISEFDELTINK
jgi:hypothetical protein